MINTLFYFVDDPTFDYQAAINRGDISQYTVVFNTADKCIYTKNTVFSKITRVDVASLLGNISDLLPVATSTTLGAIKIGFDSDDRRYGVKLDSNNRAYVEVPWTDTVAPAYDDTRVVDEIDAQRQRIDGYISQLVDTVQRCNETLLDDAQWVLRNLVAGQVGRQINDNIDEYFRQQYGVWDWVDASDHSKGKIVRTSVIEQNVDSIDIRVGSVEDYRDGYLTTALNNLEMKVGVDLVTGQTKAGTNLINAVSTLDANTNKIVQMAASALQLESVKGGGLLQSTADLASVVVNGRFTGYSGLNEKVTNQGNTISAQGSLMSRVVNNDGTPNSSFKADVIAGLATSAYVDDKVATAKAELSANIDGQGADLTLFVQKDSSGHIESSAKLSADQIYLSGTTWADIIHADQIVTDTLSGGNATFTGTVKATSGSITGNITVGNGTKKIIIVPSNDGARLAGISGNSEVMSLGFFNSILGSENAQLQFGSSYGSSCYGVESLQLNSTRYGSGSIKLSSGGVSGSGIEINHTGNLGTVRFFFQSLDEYVILRASRWPQEGVDDISALPSGTVYLRNDSCLGVRQ